MLNEIVSCFTDAKEVVLVVLIFLAADNAKLEVCANFHLFCFAKLLFSKVIVLYLNQFHVPIRTNK